MVEVIGVKVVNPDPDPGTADANKVIGEDVFIEECLDGGDVLVGKVTPYGAFIRHRIVRFADAGQQHQMHIVELEGREDHQIRRLLVFTSQCVNIGHTGGAFLVIGEIDA